MNIADLIGEIMALAIFISRNKTEVVFCEYSGHVDLLKVRIYSNGCEDSNVDPDYDVMLFLQNGDPRERLEEIKYKLQTLGGFIE